MARKRVIYRVRAATRKERAAEFLPWVVLRRNTSGAWVIAYQCETKRGAIFVGSGEARSEWRILRQPTQLVVHNRDGRIAFEATYGSDPRRRVG